MAGEQWPGSPADEIAADQWPGTPEPAKPRAGMAFRNANRQTPATPLTVTGEAHDGDTFRLNTGQNGRLYGVDAFELKQQAMENGHLVPLGQQSRDALVPYLRPDSIATPTGSQTYGRPVVSLEQGGRDAGLGLLNQGMGVAAPEYLRGDSRLTPYMEAERIARLNRRGAYAGQFQNPSDFRKGAPDPWAKPEWIDAPQPGSIAVFHDEPTPFQGLRPEVAEGYQRIWTDPKSSPDDLLAYAKTNGFIIDPDTVRKSYGERAKRGADPTIRYTDPPRLLTDRGDGATGSAIRGLSDPINMLDEMGAVVDTLGGTEGRENVWDSGRRFGDILYNNLDQNRSILAFDEANHPYARMGGQFASGIVLPGGTVEGVGLAAARQVLRNGGTRFAAEAAAKAAVRQRLSVAGAAYGGLAGFGQGEGDFVDRLPGAGIGAVTGSALGYGTGALAQELGPLARSALRRVRGREVMDGVAPSSPRSVSDDVPFTSNEGSNVAMQRTAPQPQARPSDPLETGTLPHYAGREVAPRYDRAPLTDWTPTIWREMGFNSDGFGQLPFPSRFAPRWRNEGGTDNLMFADTPELATGQGANKGILFEFDAAPFVGRPQFNKPNMAMVWRNGMGEYSTNNVTQETMQGALKGFRIKGDALTAMPETERSRLNMILGDLESQGWTAKPMEDGGTVWRRPAAMANEGAEPLPSITSPRTVDRIDVNNRARPLLDPASDMERMAQMERVNPGDVMPIPSNVVASQDEAARIAAGLYPPVQAPNEAAALERRVLPRGDDPAREVVKRGPADLITFLRSRGGMVDQGGELRALGIRDNAGRDLDFARGEQRFGRLVDNEKGMALDEAADAAWRAGYFPDHPERPTISEFLDAIDNTNRGLNRSFRPDDLAEVEAFNAARDQRLAVERAREQGAPLAEDRGQPVSMDDLEANQPPASAYEEWGEQAPDFAGNIRLANLDSPQSIQRALAQTEAVTSGFDAARRGRITQAETQSLANELGMTPDQLLSRRKGQAFNAEEALAARQILAKSANELVNMARRIQRLDDPGEEVLAAFRRALVRHVAIQEQISGATAEAGRALAQFRMMADSRNVRGNVLNALSEGGGGRTGLREAADLILEGNAIDPGSINRAARDALKPGWGDKFKELWINSLLSGPQTHVVNAVSNTMTALAQIPEHAIAAGMGGVRNLAARGRVSDRVLFTELGARSVGLLQGVKDGLRQAARTLRTGEGSDFANKIDTVHRDAISGVKGKIIRTPTRLLSSADELFKGMARRMELNGLAVRKAAAEGLRGEEGKRRAAELVANPSDEMLDQAFDYGRYLTFQRPLGKVGTAATMLSNSSPVMKVVLPFVRTPTNLLKFSLERSPAAPLLREWRKDFRAGGAKRDLALSRALVGSGVGALVAEMASQGMITGNGPADEKARNLLLADGWQPYSIKIGDQYVSYQRLDPFASTLGVAAGMVELQDHMTDKQKEDVALLVTASVMQNLSSKTWLSGMGDLVDAVNDPARYAKGWMKRTAGSLAVPAGVAQVARTIDPTLREADTVLDAVRRRVPGLSQSLPERRDVWGQPVTSEGGIGPDIVSPIWLSTRRNDSVNNALLDQDLTVPDFRRDGMSSADYGRFREEAGALTYNGVADLLASPDWLAMPLDDRQDEIRSLATKARKQTKIGMFGKFSRSPNRTGADAWPGTPVQ
ncbi:Endonuclease YncB, thermonuclease family [Sphingobium sp. YR768]|nr:Endonuclease YncB, thermonuclease family [Sphingobium sp. YR768]